MIETLPLYKNKANIQREVFEFISSLIDLDKLNIIADIFAGTASLSIPFFRYSNAVILNDKYKFIYYYLNFYVNFYNSDEIFESNILFDDLKEIKYSSFLNNKYLDSLFFGENDSIKIEAIYKYLWDNKEIYSDKVFSTTYGNFIYQVFNAKNIENKWFTKAKKIIPVDDRFSFHYIKTNKYFENMKIKIFNLDAKEIVKNIKGDLLFLDPPIGRTNISIYNPLEKLSYSPENGLNPIRYVDDFSYLDKSYIKSLISIILKANFKYVFVYFDKKSFEKFPKDFFQLFIVNKKKINNDYIVLLEKIS